MTIIEWFILLFVSFIVDIIQIILNLLGGIGVVINRIITIVYGIIVAAYLSWRGVSMVNTKRLLGIVTTFVVELIPVLDSIPTWTIDIIWTWWTTKSKIIAKATGKLDRANKLIGKIPLNKNGVRLPPPRIPSNQAGMRLPSPRISATSPQPMNIDGIRIPSLPNRN